PGLPQTLYCRERLPGCSGPSRARSSFTWAICRWMFFGRRLVFISDTIYIVSEHVQSNRSPFAPRTGVGSLDGFLARPPTSPPGLCPHHHLPLAGRRPGRLLPPPRSGRRHQPGAGPGFVGSQLLRTAPFLPFARPKPGAVDSALAADSPAPVPPPAGAGQRAGGRVGRWPQAAQGGQKDADYSEIGIITIIPSAGLFRVALRNPAKYWVF